MARLIVDFLKYHCAKLLAMLLLGVRRGQHVLDIAGGTGDLAKVFSREVGPQGHVVLSDINESML
ncbi:class I SAM-dependent methyltransferase, partial [Acinetobacter baumannii]|uniref:class I SAM-dependent methyltransferase n=1 Tax=Acinetobacter baumannii TaxID=470 RepID=UPI002B061E15